MKLLLTSAGISNASIKSALVRLLGKPIEDSSALFIPTAIYALSNGAEMANKVIAGAAGDPFCQLGWKSLGILELTALPTLKKETWLPTLEKSDALLVGGGDPQYLQYWMQQSGVADLLPTLLKKTVYVGLSAGSMVLAKFGNTYNGHTLPAETPKSLGLLNFAILAHMNHPDFEGNSEANLAKIAAKLPCATYAIDDQTAIAIEGEKLEVISEGTWKHFEAVKS